MGRPLPLRLTLTTGRYLVYGVAAILVLVGAAIGTLETGWAKNQLRALIVRQANKYLTATLDIGQLDGSLLRGLHLGDIRVSEGGRTLISIDDVEVRYSIRELLAGGTSIRAIRVTRPRVIAARNGDGRWNLASLVRRDARQNERSGPGRAIHILSLEVLDGDVSFEDPLDFGSVHVPRRYEHLDVAMAFDYQPVTWTIRFASASWTGGDSSISVTHLSGGLARGADGWVLDHMSAETPGSAFTIDGRIQRVPAPTTLDLRVVASRFAFQEWTSVLSGMKYLAVSGPFTTRLSGPLARLATDLSIQSTGGAVEGSLVLDTTVPGWHGKGALSIDRLDLARWLNRPDRPSDITGRVVFDLDLDLGRHFPRGTYTFEGPHVRFLEYAADQVRSHGTLTQTDVLVADATGAAYGSSLHVTQGSIGIDAPYSYWFQGTDNGLDLRQLPASVPVPHVESVLAMSFDVNGRFQAPFINGTAQFGDSTFLGAMVRSGAVGSINTAVVPAFYSGEGEIAGIDLHRFGAGLGFDWMQEPRYDGTVTGRFHADGTGTDSATMTLNAGGRLTSAILFDGRLLDADVSVAIAGGSLSGTYDGRFTRVNLAIPIIDPRFTSAVSGSGQARFAVRDLMRRSPTLADYDVDATLTAEPSTLRGVAIDRGAAVVALKGTSLTVTHAEAHGPTLDASGSGQLEFDGTRSSAFDYDVARADLTLAKELTGYDVAGQVKTTGRLTGPTTALRAAGEATIGDVAAGGVTALTTTATYDATVGGSDWSAITATVDGRASFLEGFGQRIQEAAGRLTYDREQIGVDLRLSQVGLAPDVPASPGGAASPAIAPARIASAAIVGSLRLHADRHAVDVTGLTATIGRATWRLADATAATPATVAWSDRGVETTPLALVNGADASQRFTVAGDWRTAGGGALHLTATHVFLDQLFGDTTAPARYGGILDAEAVVTGTRAAPAVTATVGVVEGRVRRLSYEKLAGTVNFASDVFHVDLRLDQAPGVWLTTAGAVPLGLFRSGLPEQPLDVVIASSQVSLGLIEGVTDVVRDVTGQLQVNLRAVGTSRDPHLTGTVALADTGFLMTATGARYRNGSASLELAPDRITVSSMQIEDRDGHLLNVSGSLGTHELRVGDVQIDAVARKFEVIRNETGTVEVDATLSVRGRSESPRIAGSVTILSGELKVDEILAQTLFQPYATQAAAAPTPSAPVPTPAGPAPDPGAAASGALPAATAEPVDALAALNPWERLGLDIVLHSPGSLRLTGQDVQVSEGTPLGLGSFNLRATGDLYLFKDPAQPLYVTGSFDSITGAYTFQGRRFDIDPTSSINFRGDLNPELFVTVKRVISSVEARVTIAGELRAPELRLASTPPLEASDILSLIVFNASTNELSATQQQELAVRAGTLAYGFVATPLISALQRSIGLDTLEIAPPDALSTGPRLTVGNELAPGLVAQFTRQFGQDPYDEAQVEYYLSRLFRIRATFSDAGDLIARSPFRRIERAGVDLLMLFSF